MGLAQARPNYMLERLLEQNKAITASNAECQPPTELRSQQWALAEKVVKLLKVFEEATREISGEYCSASVMIPIINTLKRTISQNDEDHGVMNMKRGMLKSISDRYKDIELQPLCVLATVLDPRFKLKVFSTASSTANARMILIKECEEYLVKLLYHLLALMISHIPSVGRKINHLLCGVFLMKCWQKVKRIL